MYPALQTLSIFWQFMRRDLFVHKKDFIQHGVNAIIIQPLLFGFAFAYIQKTVYFGMSSTASYQGTLMFLGSMIIPIVVISNKLLAELLFDLEGNRFISYQMTILNPKLVLLQRIIFAFLYTTVLMVPFLPVASLIAGSHLDLHAINWMSFIAIIMAGVLCCSSYNMLVLTLIKVSTLRSFWLRVNWPLINLGGFWVPLAVIKKFSPLLGYAALANPLTYILEGLRSAVTGSSDFMPVSLCCGVLLLFSLGCMSLACVTFKRRVDHI